MEAGAEGALEFARDARTDRESRIDGVGAKAAGGTD